VVGHLGNVGSERSRRVNDGDANRQIDAYRGGHRCLLGVAVLGSGGLAAFFSHPARIALAVALSVMAGAALSLAEI